GFNQVQLLQIMIKNAGTEEFDQQLWLDALQNTLPFVEDGYFVSNRYDIVVIHNPDHIDLNEENEGIMHVLDDDFTIQTAVYGGQNWPVDKHLPELFTEEQQIFLDTYSGGKRNKVITLPDIALAHYSQLATAKSPILRTIKENIRLLEDGPDLVY